MAEARIVVLALVAALSVAGEHEPRRVWQGPRVNTLGAPSPDGRLLSFVDPKTGELAVRELATGDVRLVTRKAPEEASQYAYFSIFGPDSKTLAYAWFNAEGFYELRSVRVPDPGAEPETPRTLFRNPEAGFVQPCAFSPDGKRILTLLFRKDNISRITLVSVEDGSSRALKSLSWIYPKRMDFSPDGRSIAYDNASSPGAYERDVFMLAADGAGETRLIGGPSNDLFPLFSPAGEAVVYSSDRSGEPAIWSQHLSEGRAAGEPRLLASGLGRFLLLGLTDTGELYFGRRRGGSRIVRLDPASGAARPLSPAGEDEALGGAVSPDGSTLAYIARVGSENYGLGARVVRLYSLDRGESKPLPVRLAHIERAAWRPDGGALLLAGSDKRGRNGLFLYDLASGRTRAVYIEPDADYRGVDAAWSRDGEALWLVRDGRTLVRRSLESGEDAVEAVAAESGRLRLPAPSPDGRRVAYARVPGASDGASRGAEVWVWNTARGESVKLLELPSGELTDLFWSPDGDELWLGTDSRAGLRLWRAAANGASLEPGPAIEGLAPGARFAPDGKALIAPVSDESEEVWVIENATRAVDR